MKIFLIAAAVLILVGFGVYYISTGDARMIKANAGPAEKSFEITLDAKTFEMLISQGKYQSVDSFFNSKNYKATEPSQKVTVVIEKLAPGSYSMDQGRAVLAEKGLKPARVEHLLALGAQYPDLSVFNTGSIFFPGEKGTIKVPFLDTNIPHKLRIREDYGEPYSISVDDWVAGIR